MMDALARLFVRDNRLRSGWRVTLYLILYLVGLLATQTLILVPYMMHLISQGTRTPTELLAVMQPARLPPWLLLALKTAELAMLLPLTYAFRRLLDRRDFVSLGFRRDHGWGWDLLLGLALGGVQILTIFGIEWASGWLSVGLLDSKAFMQGLAAGGVVTVLFVLVAVGEELNFRGYLLVNLRDGTNLILALILSSLLFGVFHALNPNFNPLALINITLAGLAFGYGWQITGNLWLPMAYHFSWNFFQGPIFSLPVSGVRYGGLLAVTDLGTAPIVTGAAFGPEGGIVGTLTLLSTFPLLWLWGRWRQEKVENGK